MVSQAWAGLRIYKHLGIPDCDREMDMTSMQQQAFLEHVYGGCFRVTVLSVRTAKAHHAVDNGGKLRIYV